MDKYLIFKEKFVIPLRAPKSDFPSDVLRSIKADAKPLTSIKLMQICKYFCYKKFPYLVITAISSPHFYEFRFRNLNNKWINNISANKIWMSGTFDFGIRFGSMQSFPSLKTRIVANDISCLKINFQHLYLNEFKLLTSSKKLKSIFIENSFIKYDTDDLINLEDMLKCVPYAEKLHIRNNVPKINCIKTLCQYFPSKLENLIFFVATAAFNLNAFKKLVKNKPHVKYNLEFSGRLWKNFTKKLRKYAKEIIKTGVTEYPPVYLKFDFQSRKSLRKLKALKEAYELQQQMTKNFLHDQQ